MSAGPFAMNTASSEKLRALTNLGQIAMTTSVDREVECCEYGSDGARAAHERFQAVEVERLYLTRKFPAEVRRVETREANACGDVTVVAAGWFQAELPDYLCQRVR